MRASMRRAAAVTLFLALALLSTREATAEDRFPRPDFLSGYELPALQVPAARSTLLQYLDVALLAAALGAGAWLALRRRSRAGLLLLTVGSVVYFGFVRRGCVCSIGSIQNVLYALRDPSYAIPAPVVAFFALPLVAALLGGRVFCGGVCPLGAIQDLVLVRPRRLPEWIAAPLGLLPPLALGLAVLAVATGSDFLICRFDPFVGIFRFSAEIDMAIAGGALLALGTVVGRPYCRFLCPYSVLLKLASRLSWRHLSSTPTECVNCGLCVKACPFGAIAQPEDPEVLYAEPRAPRRLALLFLSLPVAAATGSLVGTLVAPQAARMHPAVRMARAVAGGTELGQSFLDSGTPVDQLREEANAAVATFLPGTAIFGAYAGVLFAGAAAATMLRRPRSAHAPHRGRCLSCGRCIAACPKEQEVRRARRAERDQAVLAATGAGGRPNAGT